MGHTTQPNRTKQPQAVPCVRPLQKQRSLSKFYGTKSRSFTCIQDAMSTPVGDSAEALSKALGQRFFVACTKSRSIYNCTTDDICMALLQTTLSAAVSNQGRSASPTLVPQ